MLIHEHVTVADGLEVDAGIASLLEALWALGLRTSHSCKGTAVDDGEAEDPSSAAYISFPGAADALEFFSHTLEAISTPDRKAMIVVQVRLLTKAGRPGWQHRRPGPALSLEFDVDHDANERDLRGCVRFDPELMPHVEAAFRPASGTTKAGATESAGVARSDGPAPSR